MDFDIRRDSVPKTNYIIYQNKKGFSYTLDSLLLMDFVELKGKVCDLGAGTGILSLLATNFRRVTEVVAVERVEKYYCLLEKTITENNLEDKIILIKDSIIELPNIYPTNYFDAIVMNPPYYKNSLENEEEDRTLARHDKGELDLFFNIARYGVKNGGKVFLVYPTHRLTDIFKLCNTYSLEPKRLAFIKKNVDASPLTFLLEARKSGGSFLNIEKDIVLYNLDGSETEVLKRIK